MPLNKTANDAIAAVDELEKTAGRFENYSDLSTEDLVKRALQRFMKNHNPDSILAGIKQASTDDRALASAAMRLINNGGSTDPMMEELYKRTGRNA